VGIGKVHRFFVRKSHWLGVIALGLTIYVGFWSANNRLEAEPQSIKSEVIDRNVVAQNVERLLKTRECSKCDLRGADLTKDKISGYPLSNNYKYLPAFTDSYGRVEIDGGMREPIVVNLRGANLEGANLIGIDLAFADLRDANLAQTRIEETFLYKADLRGTNLRGSTIKNSVLTCANLQNARNFSGFKKTDFLKETVYFSFALDRVVGERITGFSGSMACLAKLPNGNLYTDDCKNASVVQEFKQLLGCFGDS
jgi:Pentapeptide repeats (8 copies)